MFKVVASLGKPFEADLDFADPFTADVSAEAAFLEGRQVAAHRRLSLLDLVDHGGELGAVCLVLARAVLPLGADGVGDEFGVAVEVEQCSEDSLIHLFGGQAECVAAVAAVADA